MNMIIFAHLWANENQHFPQSPDEDFYFLVLSKNRPKIKPEPIKSEMQKKISNKEQCRPKITYYSKSLSDHCN